MKKETKKFRKEEKCVCCEDISCKKCECDDLSETLNEEKKKIGLK